MTDVNNAVERGETDQLIASNKVEGTAVYDHAGNQLGAIHNFMVDKRSGQVQYAVLQFGGFLGIGKNYYPLPWKMLNYSLARGGYEVDVDKSMLEKAPHYSDQEPRYDRAYGESVHTAYGMDYLT